MIIKSDMNKIKHAIALLLSITLVAMTLPTDVSALRPKSHRASFRQSADESPAVNKALLSAQDSKISDSVKSRIKDPFKSKRSLLAILKKSFIAFTALVLLFLNIYILWPAFTQFSSSTREWNNMSAVIDSIPRYRDFSEMVLYLKNAVKQDYAVYVLYCVHKDIDAFYEIKPALDVIFDAAKKEKKQLFIYQEDAPLFSDKLIEQGLTGRDPVKGEFTDKGYKKALLEYIRSGIDISQKSYSNQWWKAFGNEYLQKYRKKDAKKSFGEGTAEYLFDMANKGFIFTEAHEPHSVESCLKTLDVKILWDELIEKQRRYDLMNEYTIHQRERDSARDNAQVDSIAKIFNVTPSQPIVIIRGAGHRQLLRFLRDKGYNVYPFISEEHRQSFDIIYGLVRKVKLDNIRYGILNVSLIDVSYIFSIWLIMLLKRKIRIVGIQDEEQEVKAYPHPPEKDIPAKLRPEDQPDQLKIDLVSPGSAAKSTIEQPVQVRTEPVQLGPFTVKRILSAA